jgi:hypothetical protein
MYEKYGKELRDIQAMRQRLLKQRRDDLVILCICRGSLCSEARLLLKPEHFSLPDEKPHRMIIRHLWRLLDGNLYAPGQVPYAALYDALAAEFVTLKPAELDEPWVGETINDPTQAGWEGAEPGLLWQAYARDPVTYDDAYAFETLKLFLEERVVVDAVAGLVATTAGARVPLDHTAQLTAILATARRIESVGTSPFRLPMPPGWLPTPLIVFPTGAAWIDDVLGGQTVGDVNGLIGMFGGGKTTALTQIAVGSAIHFLEEAKESGARPRIALLVSYEEHEETILPRIMSCAARISKTRLEQMGDLSELSRRGQLRDYEITMYREEREHDSANLDGEYERFIKASAWVNEALRIVDMRDGGRGYGWVDELAACIERFRDENQVEIGVVCLDYVNAMVRRYVDTLPRITDATLRDKIQKTPLLVEEKIARRFQCPVWLAQQFSGEANKKAPTARMMLADASEARSFGENLVFCVAFGATDPKTGVMQTTFVKSRRLGKQGKTVLTRLEGDLGRIRPVDHLYVVHNDRIVERRLVKQMLGATAEAGPGNKSPFMVTGASLSPGPLWDKEAAS